MNMNKELFNSAIRKDVWDEICEVSHYSERRMRRLLRVTDYVGYILGGIMVAFPVVFGIIGNVMM